MKINQLNKNIRPSFGLKIKENEGYNEFINIAGGKNWQCSEEDLNEFTTKLKQMHFAHEKSDDTNIIFESPQKEIVGYMTVPSITFRNKFVTQPVLETFLPCTIFKTNDDASRITHFGVKLTGSSLDDILQEIAINYAKHTYSKK